MKTALTVFILAMIASHSAMAGHKTRVYAADHYEQGADFQLQNQ